MENILRYGPKRISLNEIAGGGMVTRKERCVIPLSESSLNRMMQHGKTGMVIISANRSEIDSSDPELSLRGEFESDMEKAYGSLDAIDSDALYDLEEAWLAKRNALADKELKNDIRAAGYSYTPVYGGYHGKDDVIDEYEPSYVVYNYQRGDDNPGDFYDLQAFACDMCRKYKQESVYVQRPGDPPVYLDADGNQVNMFSSKDFKFNDDDQEFFTTTSRDRSQPHKFTADVVFESMYIPLRPASYNERLRRTKQGEFIL